MADKNGAHKQQLMQLDDNNNQGNNNSGPTIITHQGHQQQTSVIPATMKSTTSTAATILIKQQPTTNTNTTTTASNSTIDSTPPSPKAKSAPATPCNITPIAFHQTSNYNGGGGSGSGGETGAGGSHYLNLSPKPSPANTMPPDMRKNISATCRLLPSSIKQTQPLVLSNNTSIASAQQQLQQLQINHHSPKATTNGGGGSGNNINSRHLDELIKRGELALEAKEYLEAVQVFSQCIELAKNSLSEKQNIIFMKENFKIYSQRAEAHFSLGNYQAAIEDSIEARDLNPKWTQAYYLQGRAQFQLKKFADSLAVFSFGLAQEPTNKRLLEALVDSALKSNFKQEFQLEYKSLKALGYDKKPFVVVSILGQELLAAGHGQHAAIVLESALKMFNQITTTTATGSEMSQNNNSCGGSSGGSSTSCATTTTTTNNSGNATTAAAAATIKKFKGSVLSSLALAYCLMKDYEKAINYMQKELEIESDLEDIAGQCRVLSNLGHTYFRLRRFDKSLEVHRRQVNLALRNQLFQQASSALNALGHVHSARLDYTNALTSHTGCLDILKQLGDNPFSQFKELLSIGHIHTQLNDFKASEEKYSEAKNLLKQVSSSSSSAMPHSPIVASNGSSLTTAGAAAATTATRSTIGQEELKTGLIMLKFNMAHLALKKQSYQEAVALYGEIMQLAQRISSSPKRLLYEMRAANGMGQTYRLSKDFDEARHWFEKQLQLANQLQSDHHKQFSDEVGQSQALSNLAMTCQHFKDYPTAGRLFDENMRLVDENKNPLLKAYAHSYLASMFFLTGRYNDAQAHYENSSNLFKDLQFCSSERKTIDLNMALVHERMGGGYSNSELQLQQIQQQQQQQQQQSPAAAQQQQQHSINNDQTTTTNQQQILSSSTTSNNNSSPLVISNNSINLTPTVNNTANNNGGSAPVAVNNNGTSVQISTSATVQQPQQTTQKKVMMAA